MAQVLQDTPALHGLCTKLEGSMMMAQGVP